MTLHVMADDSDGAWDMELFVMRCGLLLTFAADLSIRPAGHDMVRHPHPDVDCPGCALAPVPARTARAKADA